MTPGSVKVPVTCDLHHAHLFARDLGASIHFYQGMFGAEVVLDDEVAGARNVLLRLGSAYINFYDQPPKDTGRGIVHHLGIRTTDLASLVGYMKSEGFERDREPAPAADWREAGPRRPSAPPGTPGPGAPSLLRTPRSRPSRRWARRSRGRSWFLIQGWRCGCQGPAFPSTMLAR
jgi:catechol 2,3-dioxygenase-like lactoylglutathione lyase family enzyme